MSLRTIILVFIVSVIAMIGFVNGCKDNGSTPTNPPPPTFGVAPTSLNMTVGDSSVQTISGGTTPYVVVDTGNTSVARAFIAGSSLTIRAVGIGTSRVIIGDNSSPQLRDSVSVTVSSNLISFANQIQLIFNTNCAVSGCHVTGGSAPFTLQSGQSYGELVNIPATRGPCASTFFRVKPSIADSSALYRRISGTSCGIQMPVGGSLTSTQINLIRDWINQGAQNN